eukprot:2412968-Rhodomonas_salina.10
MCIPTAGDMPPHRDTPPPPVLSLRSPSAVTARTSVFEVSFWENLHPRWLRSASLHCDRAVPLQQAHVLLRLGFFLCLATPSGMHRRCP